MEKTFHSLVEILNKQRNLHADLLRLMEGAHDALEHYRVEEIDIYNKAVETIKLKADVLERARRNIVDQIAKSQGYPPQSLKMSRVAELAPMTLRPSFAAIQMQLDLLIEKITERNQLNLEAARSSLWAVSNLSRYLQQIIEEPLTYQPKTVAGRTIVLTRSA
jgi:hypothetical protein